METIQIDEFYQPMLVVGDVHLVGFDEVSNRNIQNDFLAVVEYAVKNSFGLILLGDIFDYWMEYPGKKTPPQFAEVCAVLKRFINQKYWILGNHDCWDRGFFQNQLGFRVTRDMLEISNPNARIMHGDGKPDADFLTLKRPLMHRILRDPTFVHFYQTITGSQLGWKLMSLFSRFNRAISSEKAGFTDHIETIFENKPLPCSLLIAGHDHIPRVRRFDEGLYVNLGNFYDDRSFALLTSRTIKWCYWQNGEVIESTQQKI
jgi:UDP-2,3-diacylglucosamine hydrolase